MWLLCGRDQSDSRGTESSGERSHMSVGLWPEGIVVVVSATFPENSLTISLWLGRAEGGWEAWGLFCAEATCCYMRARRGGWCRVEGTPGQGCPPDFQALPQASLSHGSGQGGLRDDPNSLTSGHLCICNYVSGSFPCGLSVESFWILPSHSVSFFLGLLLCHISVCCPLNLGDYVP